jgi:hypothetical protein
VSEPKKKMRERKKNEDGDEFTNAKSKQTKKKPVHQQTHSRKKTPHPNTKENGEEDRRREEDLNEEGCEEGWCQEGLEEGWRREEVQEGCQENGQEVRSAPEATQHSRQRARARKKAHHRTRRRRRQQQFLLSLSWSSRALFFPVSSCRAVPRTLLKE